MILRGYDKVKSTNMAFKNLDLGRDLVSKETVYRNKIASEKKKLL